MTLRKGGGIKRGGRPYCIEFFLGQGELKCTHTLEGKKCQRRPQGKRKNSEKSPMYVSMYIACIYWGGGVLRFKTENARYTKASKRIASRWQCPYEK